MKKYAISLAKLAATANTLESQMIGEWQDAEWKRQDAYKAADQLEALLIAEFSEPNRAEGSLLQIDGNTMSFQQRIPGNWDHLRIVQDELGNVLVEKMLRDRLWKVCIVLRKIKCTKIAATIPAAYTVEVSMVASPNAEICEEKSDEESIPYYKGGGEYVGVDEKIYDLNKSK